MQYEVFMKHKAEMEEQNMIRKKIRITAAVLAAALLISSNVFATTTAEYDQKINDLRTQQSQLDEESAALNAKLESLKGQIDEKLAYQQTLEEKIGNLRKRIDTATASINELNKDIKYLEEQIKAADEEHTQTYEQLKKRLRALYMAGGDLTTLEILLDATSLHDFSMRTEAIQKFTQHDKELMEIILNYMQESQAQRDDLQTKKDDLAQQKLGLEKDQSELQAVEAENAALIEELNIESDVTEQEIAENEEASAEYLASLDVLIAERSEQAAREAAAANPGGTGGGIGGGGSAGTPNTDNDSGILNTGSLSFRWPLAGYGYESITQYYGNNGHNGLDIGIPYGTPIYASEAGQVISAEYHWSWGNNVLIWHNSTYSTRYAHCTSLAVSAGEYVAQGQVIGYAGSTGNSTGPHLHFEVYENGTRINPSNFV